VSFSPTKTKQRTPITKNGEFFDENYRVIRNKIIKTNAKLERDKQKPKKTSEIKTRTKCVENARVVLLQYGVSNDDLCDVLT